MSNGSAGEKMLTSILSTMGFEDRSKSYSRELLLDKVRKIRPGRLENVKSKREEAGKPTNWDITSPRLILDWVYGLDTVFEVDANGRLFAVDFTVDCSKVNKKVQKLKAFKPLWKALNIQKVAVVLIVPPKSEFGLGLLTQKEREKIEDDLYEFIFSMDESSLDVTKHIVSW